MSKTIPLRGKYSHLSTIVDDDVYKWASKIKWYVLKTKEGKLYVQGAVNGNKVYLHRLVAAIPEKPMVDHVSGETLDNRRSNLRPSTHAENMRNSQSRNKTGFKGVRLQNNRFFAYITVDSEKLHLGCHKRLFDAVLAYDTASYVYHGEFARPNCENMSEAMADALAAEALKEMFAA